MVRVLVLTGNGTNCEYETSHVLKLAGADQVDVRMVWELLDGVFSMEDYDMIVFPGGFMDGDHLGSARATAHRFTHARPGGQRPVVEQIMTVHERGGLVIGICNGFQLLVKLGLLPWPGQGQKVTLTHNLSGRFEDRWVHLAVDKNSPCVFTRGLERLELPVRHGEGRLVFAPEVLEAVNAAHLAPLRYVHPDQSQPTEEYPHNPNGSPQGIAALTDPTGRIFGLMPHPEAFTHRTNHPRWTRLPELPEEGVGVQIFRNAIQYLKG